MLKRLISLFSWKDNLTPRSSKEYIALDIVISKVIPEGTTDWNIFRPFGICCAVAVTSSGGKMIWHSKTEEGVAANQISREQVSSIIDYLRSEVAGGKTIVSWNGLGFDFRTLAEESGMQEECKALALGHIDMMFHLLCNKGYPLSFEKAIKGMGLSRKSSNMDRTFSVEDWGNGCCEDVLNYALNNAKTKLDLFLETESEKQLCWLSERNKLQTFPLPQGWLTVCRNQRLPLPDTSWMTTSWPREMFTAWIINPIESPLSKTNVSSGSETNISPSDIKTIPDPEWSSSQYTMAFIMCGIKNPDIWNKVIGQRLNHPLWGIGIIKALDLGESYDTSRITVQFDHQVETIAHGFTDIVELGFSVLSDGIATFVELPIDIRIALREWVQFQKNMEKESCERKEEERVRLIQEQRVRAEFCQDIPEDWEPEYHYDQENDNEYLDGEPI